MVTGQDERHTPVVFLLGAGASVDAGCPTVEQLVDTFDAFLEERQAYREKQALEAIKGLLAEFSTSRRGEVVVDVELLLATIRQLSDRERNPISAFVRQWNREVGKHTNYLPKLDELLQEHIRHQCTVASDKVQYLWPIGQFVDHYGHLDVFSLNYDAAVEIVCQQKEIPYTDGFKLYWDPGDFREARNRLCLFKLHGSLLWYVTHGVPRKLVKIPIRASASGGVQFFTDEKVSHVLIYPTLAKEQHIEPYATLMGELRTALAGAEVLVAVGCSFRDEYIKQVIIERMLQNPHLQLVVVDPAGAEVVNRSDSIVGPEWAFEAVGDRVSLFHASAREALGGRRLLDHVRGIQELASLREEYDRSLLSGASEPDQQTRAAAYAAGLIRSRHVGALTTLIRSGPADLRIALLGQVRSASRSHDANAAAAVAVLIVSLADDEGYRKLAGDWLRSHMQWVLEYVVWRSGSAYHTILAGEPRPAIKSVRDFFLSHARRIQDFHRQFRPWALAMHFGPIHDTAAHALALLEDLDHSRRYFEAAAHDNGYAHFEAGFPSERQTVFPQGRDESIMEELGRRFEDQQPRSLLRILGEV
jgi:hypothetical protein